MRQHLAFRRRCRQETQPWVVLALLLLLISVSLLYARISSSSQFQLYLHSNNNADPFAASTDDTAVADAEDKIDEFDSIEEDQGDVVMLRDAPPGAVSSPRYFMDHITGSTRRAFSKRSIDEWDYDSDSLTVGLQTEDTSINSFGSDDMPMDEKVRVRLSEVGGIEDALMLKSGRAGLAMRDGWGDWFDKKCEFLRKNGMFRSNADGLNPMNNPLLHDPSGVGVTGLTRWDKAVQKMLLNEIEEVPFLLKMASSAELEEWSEINREKKGSKRASSDNAWN